MVSWERFGETDAEALERRIAQCGDGERLFVRYDNGQLCAFRRK